MLRTLLILAGMTLSLSAQTISPVPRTDPNSKLAHDQLVQKARTGRIDLYFLGDSITRRWGATDPQYKDFLANWKENFFGWNAANFGWGGDTVQNILWRIQNGELDNVNPKVVVLMAGTNNLGNRPLPDDKAKVEEVTNGIKAILETIRAKAPNATIILMGITPRNDGPAGRAAVVTIDRINQNLSALADGKRVRCLNINDKLVDGEGNLLEGVTVDRLHLSLKGYQIWADALKPVLAELLGPRATTDQAPAPTGDPSAVR